MLTTLSQKRDFQVAMLALNKHDKEEEEKEQGESTIQSGPSSKSVKREAKVESLKDKRRKIRDRGEHLDSQLAEEGNRITEILEQVASALLSPPTDRHSVPTTISKRNSPCSPLPIEPCPANLEFSNPLPQSLHSAMSNPPPAGWDLARFSQLEQRIQVVEMGLKEVQEGTKKILKILESGNSELK